MNRPSTYRKPSQREMRVLKKGCAQDAIGKLEKNQDVYILTYGQFSLIDALFVILDQTGPADVVISSWTAADAHLEHVSHMMEAANILSLRLIVDRSFRTRQPAYHRRMREIFGQKCIRALRTHAKFMVITNNNWHVVVRTSMNLNENPRLENIEISENANFANFMLDNIDQIFAKLKPDNDESNEPNLNENSPFALINAKQMEFENLNIPETTHVA
jgi:hypothetical protein